MSFAIVAAVAAPLVVGGINMAINNKKAKDMEGELQAAQGNINRLLADIFKLCSSIKLSTILLGF